MSTETKEAEPEEKEHLVKDGCLQPAVLINLYNFTRSELKKRERIIIRAKSAEADANEFRQAQNDLIAMAKSCNIMLPEEGEKKK